MGQTALGNFLFLQKITFRRFGTGLQKKINSLWYLAAKVKLIA